MRFPKVAEGRHRLRALTLSAALVLAGIGGAKLVWNWTNAKPALSFITGTIPSDHIVLPSGQARSVVVLFSGMTGWKDTDQVLADELIARSAAVVGIALPEYLSNLANKSEDCHYLISDIESLSHQIQRATGGADYRAPILAGSDMGGGLALDLVDQTPSATIGATVVSDPAVAVPLDRPLCTDAKHTENDNGEIYTLPSSALVDPVTVVLSPSASVASRARAEAFGAAASGASVSEGAGSEGGLFAAALFEEVDKISAAPEALPVQVLGTIPTHGTMAIILSGDGGWRDLDRTIGGIFQTSGVPTVGLDSLRYFWGKRTPVQVAQDITSIVSRYSGPWNAPDVLLMGYSFGADVLPAAYLALDPAMQARVKQISLLGLSPAADWEITVSGWLDGPSPAATPTGPSLARIPAGLMQCVYGVAETDSPCPGLGKSGVETLQTEGGHHFDGNYRAIAQDILTSLDQRRARENEPRFGLGPARTHSVGCRLYPPRRKCI